MIIDVKIRVGIEETKKSWIPANQESLKDYWNELEGTQIIMDDGRKLHVAIWCCLGKID